ncbi:PREDICTED: spermatogenesis-associated protein 31E1-like [Galeopterus variegatus]|uniref:Spermatogenesis-associated protein 31E1-like n=1 Tax=Galeopterus variegatus TaxID=482537 RepID=A0ABM0SJB5_GALVR|nr:PREDICTED: spermatogenesis-associated protein 31E1-like [Galeopterus variegatus]
MENLLFTLKSVSATWLSPSSVSWVVEITFAFLGGVGLFLLLLPCLQKDGSLPSKRKKRNLRKHQVETRSSRSRKSGALHACRDGLGELKEVQGLISLLQSHLAEIPDPPGEVCKPAPARAHQPCWKNLEDSAPVTLSPLTIQAPLVECPLPVASTLSPGQRTSTVSVESRSPLSASQPSEPLLPPDSLSTPPLAPVPPLSRPPDPVASHLPPADSSLSTSQWNTMALPLGSIPQSLSPHNCWLTSPTPAISSLSHPSCPIPALSWWQMAAKVSYLPTSSQGQSHQEGVSHHPTEAPFSGDPTQSYLEAGGPSFVNPNIQKLLERLITKRTGQKIRNDKQKEKSDYSLDSLGNTLKSLGDKQDTRTPQPFWSMKDKPKQLPGPEQLSDPKVLEDHLQRKTSQHYWGLPFLHSESLVATIRVSGSPLEFPSVLFNELSHSFPVQNQTQLSPQFFQPRLWSPHVPQPQPLTPALPLSQPSPLAETHSQPHTSSCLPIPPCYSPQIVARGAACPTDQMQAELLIPTSIPRVDCHPSKKEQESRRDLPTMVQNPQEAFNQLTPESEASQENESVSLLPGDFISPELREQLEKHLQRRFTQHCCGLSPKLREQLEKHLQQRFTQHCCGLSHRPHVSPDLIQPQDLQQRFTQHCCGLSHRPHMSLDLIQPQDEFPGISQPQDEFPGTSQVKDRHGPSVFVGGSSQNTQKMESRGPAKFQLGKIPSKDPKQCLWSVLEHLPRASESSSGKVPEAKTEKKSERDWMTPLGSDSGKDSPRSSDMKHLEDTAEVLLHRKVGEVNEDMVPVGVHHPSLANGHVLSPENSNTHMETGNLAPSKGKVSHVNTSQQLSFLDVHTRQMLEAHIKSFQASHEWGPTLKVHKPPYLKVRKAQPLSLSQPAFPSSATTESGAKCTAEAANVPGEPPHKDPGEKVAGKMSLSTLCRPLPVPLPVCKEAQRSAYNTETKSGDKCRPSEDPLIGQEGRWPSQPLICNAMGTTCHSANVLGAKRDSLELSAGPAMSRSSQGQEKPRNPKFQKPQKSLSQMFGPTDQRGGHRRPAQGNHEQTLVGLSPPAKDRKPVKFLSTQSSQLPPEKGQAPPESHFKKRIRHFLQWIVPSEKGKGQKDPLQKGKPASAPARSWVPVPSGLFADNCVAEAQALMTAVGQILEEKMGLHHEVSASTAPVGGRSCHHRGPSYPEQRTVVRGMACCHHATPVGHSHPVKYRWIRDGNSSGASLPRESPCQHRPLAVRASVRSIHCPRHCHLQRGVWSGQPVHTSHPFLGGKSFPPEYLQPPHK